VTDWKVITPQGRELLFPDIGMLYCYVAHSRFNFIRPTLLPMNLVDVGGCVGSYALAFFESVPNGTAQVFEPNPICRDYLLHNLAGYPTTISETAAYKEATELSLSYPKDFSKIGNSSIYGDGQDVFKTQAVRLDDAVTGRVDVVKIDVEGAELDVLMGAERILSQDHPALFVELKTTHQKRAGRTILDVVNYLAAKGYKDHESYSSDFLFVWGEKKGG